MISLFVNGGLSDGQLVSNCGALASSLAHFHGGFTHGSGPNLGWQLGRVRDAVERYGVAFENLTGRPPTTTGPNPVFDQSPAVATPPINFSSPALEEAKKEFLASPDSKSQNSPLPAGVNEFGDPLNGRPASNSGTAPPVPAPPIPGAAGSPTPSGYVAPIDGNASVNGPLRLYGANNIGAMTPSAPPAPPAPASAPAVPIAPSSINCTFPSSSCTGLQIGASSASQAQLSPGFQPVGAQPPNIGPTGVVTAPTGNSANLTSTVTAVPNLGMKEVVTY
jgi:hypothetical protein